MDTLQINSINRILGQLYFRLGIQQIREHQSDFTSEMFDFNKFQNAIIKAGITANVVPLDNQYWFASWDNWQKIISILNPIAQNFQWEPERFDCDNRATLMNALCALMFRINTCATCYCSVYMADTDKFLFAHYCNLIVDKDDNVYLWDVDQNGISQKITGNSVVMGVHKYNLIGIRVY